MTVLAMTTRKKSPEAAAPTKPWDGVVDDDEMSRPGGMLLGALVRTAIERGQSFTDMARELRVTYGYVNQLRNGNRAVNQISDDFALSCARYLGVPRLTVLMMAGRIRLEDFYEVHSLRLQTVAQAFRSIQDDPTWGPMVPEKLLQQNDFESMLLVVRLYEQATGKQLLPGIQNPGELAQAIKDFKETQASR